MSKPLLEALGPILDHLETVDMTSPTAAQDLNTSLPIDSPLLRQVRNLVVSGIEAGELTPRGEEGMRYGRLAKATEDSRGFSIDAVHMDRPGPGHTHPNGEIDLCFDLSGSPLFDGEPPGWVVKKPGSWHIPTVSGGDMAILYFLPEGAIRFEARPE